MREYNGFKYRLHKFADGGMLQPRPWGFESVVVLQDDQGNEFSVTSSHRKRVRDIDLDDVAKRVIDRIKEQKDFESQRSRILDVDYGLYIQDDFLRVLRFMVRKVREKPKIKISNMFGTGLEDLRKKALPESVFTVDEVLAILRANTEIIGYLSFKDHVLNRKFSELGDFNG